MEINVFSKIFFLKKNQVVVGSWLRDLVIPQKLEVLNLLFEVKFTV
jgi:hypothetical protein